MPRKQLSEEDELQWNIRTVATVHALVLVVGAVLSFFTLRYFVSWRLKKCILEYSSS